MSARRGWIGVDLDGTLAEYSKWDGGRIGRPVDTMVSLVKALIAGGWEVRVFTARVSDPDPKVAEAIIEWCCEHIGMPLEVTNVKDFSMVALLDDRAIAIEKNTGRILGGELPR